MAAKRGLPLVTSKRFRTFEGIRVVCDLPHYWIPTK